MGVRYGDIRFRTTACLAMIALNANLALRRVHLGALRRALAHGGTLFVNLHVIAETAP